MDCKKPLCGVEVGNTLPLFNVSEKYWEMTAQSYKLGLLRKKEKNFLQILLISGENLQCTSTEMNHSRA